MNRRRFLFGLVTTPALVMAAPSPPRELVSDEPTPGAFYRCKSSTRVQWLPFTGPVAMAIDITNPGPYCITVALSGAGLTPEGYARRYDLRVSRDGDEPQSLAVLDIEPKSPRGTLVADGLYLMPGTRVELPAIPSGVDARIVLAKVHARGEPDSRHELHFEARQ